MDYKSPLSGIGITNSDKLKESLCPNSAFTSNTENTKDTSLAIQNRCQKILEYFTYFIEEDNNVTCSSGNVEDSSIVPMPSA